MRNRDIEQMRQDLEELNDIKENLEESISKFLSDISLIEKELDREYSLSHILGQTRATLESVDVDNIFDFIDDLESEISTLNYKEKRVLEANKMSIYQKSTSLTFYRPTFTGDGNDLFKV